MAKLLILFRLVPFRSIPYRLRGRWGCARTLILTFSQGEKGPASVASLWPRLASSGVVRSGETFNSVAFDCIWLHSYRLRGRWGCARTLILTFSQGEKGPASVASLWPRLASSGVVRSGKTFKTRSFPLIPLVDGGDAGWGWRGSRLRGNDGGIRVNDACDQCTGWRGDGAMGSCRTVC